eukprot:gnl/TRDRNA2_/TRDRNA2_85131_c0_seq1.p1 gnl/TRDRNA2_/TRDRNA2_85131_c0~~gnl/TRDRNA2_/TRDRNA2_85131_c0_seq1.p1  ORF type:complete len:683 (-),score=126.98 gnl/TRDRNA2_/TRDRNA2_85131_c0_seq1:239-2257(-)
MAVDASAAVGDQEVESDDEGLAEGLLAMLGGVEADSHCVDPCRTEEEHESRPGEVPTTVDEQDEEEDGAEEEEEADEDGYDEEQEEIDVEGTAQEGMDDGDADQDDDGDGAEFFLDVDGAEDVPAADADVDELISVPKEALEHLIGKDGETLKRLSAECGANLSVVSAGKSGKMISAHGSAEAKAVACRLIRNMIAEVRRSQEKGKGKRKGAGRGGEDPAGGASGSVGCSQGLCKWFAAGFCRNKAPSGSCRNGLHDAEAVKKAEAAWIAHAPVTGSVKTAKKPLLLLLDLEGGGNPNGRDGENEIIEVPVLAMCPLTGSELGRFHRFVRPGHWDREKEQMSWRHHASCFNEAASSVPFPEVIASLLSWIGTLLEVPPSRLSAEDFLFVTCGDWDVKIMLPKQCNNPSPGTIDIATQRLLFARWCNLKYAFRDHFKLPEFHAPTGMRGMLNRLKIELSGQHHLGMDDVSNLAKVLKALVCQGATIEPTGFAEARSLRDRKRSAEGAPDGLPAGSAPRLGSDAPYESPSACAVASPEEVQQRCASAPQSIAAVAATTAPSRGAPAAAAAAPRSAEPAAAPVAPAPRSAGSILAKYSNSQRAEALGHEVKLGRKHRVTQPAGSPALPRTPWRMRPQPRGASAGDVVPSAPKPSRRGLRGSPSILSQAAGKQRRH